MALGALVLGSLISLILYLKGRRRMMLQLSGFYYRAVRGFREEKFCNRGFKTQNPREDPKSRSLKGVPIKYPLVV